MVKLNLASGSDVRPPPWRNLDVVSRWPTAARACDEIWDARRDKIPYADNSVEEVYAGYLLLHLAPQHHQPVLRDIYRVLKPGGRLVVGEVDMAVLLPRWLANPGDAYLSGLLWGEQGQLSPEQERDLGPLAVDVQRGLADFDKHCKGFVESTLRAELKAAGFTKEARRIQIHDSRVFYELTLEVNK